MKIKFRINNQPVTDLQAWCEKRNLVYVTFRQALRRAKLKGSNECYPRGFHVIKLTGGLKNEMPEM